MRPFAYQSPASLDEALSLLPADGWRGLEDGAARPLAGGTDLITLLKGGLAAPLRLLDVKRLPDLPRGIVEGPDGLILGALTTLAEVEQSPLLQERYPALAEAAALAATPQLRNMATLGGNLLQRPRCWYYRHPHLDCWLKGGQDCPARDGQNQLHAIFHAPPEAPQGRQPQGQPQDRFAGAPPESARCVAVHPSDPATALHALGASVRLQGKGGQRTLPLEQLFAPPTDERRTETVVGADELLLDVHLPALPPGTRSTYLKAMDRKVWAFALVGVAAVVRLEGRRIVQARITLGGVANVPWRATAAERLLQGAEVDDALIARAATAALEGAQPLEHNAYKVPLTTALVRRALSVLTATAS
jgi:xanthine dehydrogenase YagS FAD-binding subunit